MSVTDNSVTANSVPSIWCQKLTVF